jgi:hypothetical protein
MDKHIKLFVQPKKRSSQYSRTFRSIYISGNIAVLLWFGEFGQRSAQYIFISSMQNDAGPVFGKDPGNPQTDPAARAGDQTDSVG